MSDRPPAEPIVLSVCVSCRALDGPDDARPGATLLAALLARSPETGPDISVRAVQCLSVCKRPCTVALTSPGRYTYVFGDVDPVSGAADLLACAATYRDREHGFLLWRERPESLRRGILVRVPPTGWASPDGAHPR